jgi:cation transport ATPase
LATNDRLAAIQRLMERAAAEKPRLVELADRVAGRFIVALLVLAVVTAEWPGGGSTRRARCGFLSPCWW